MPSFFRRSLSSTPPNPSPRTSAESFPPSHNPSISTTSTAPTAPTTAGSTSTCNRIVSSFNPTLTLSIPPNSFTSKPVPIQDLTPFLLTRRTCSDPAADRRSFKEAVKGILTYEQPDTLMTFTTTRTGTNVLEHYPSGQRIAKWKVPWRVTKPVHVVLGEKPQDKKDTQDALDIYSPPHAPRTVEFTRHGATYVWRQGREPEEWVLEKRAREIGRYVVGVYLRRRDWRGEGGTLLIDARGVEVELAVVSVGILGKRERQRWLVGGAVPEQGKL